MEEYPTESFKNEQISFQDIPASDRLEMVSLEKQFLKVMLVNMGIVYFLILVAALYVWWIDKEAVIKPYFQWILLGFLIVFLLNLFLVNKGFQYKSYAIRQHDITYKSGWLWRKITTVPFSRVQHCEVSQNMVDRIWDLSRLKIYTAGGSSSDITIPGLNHQVANDLKGYILKKVDENE